MMSRRTNLIVVALLVLCGGAMGAYVRQASVGETMTAAANKYVDTLNDEQKATSLLTYDTPKRVEWHFIPKKTRKGLQIKHMKEDQRKAALALLRSCLSQVGYDKAVKIMELEKVLAALEKGREGGPVRDHERYYYTIFGKPSDDGKWGLSIEGHHLSLNFVVAKGKIVSSTPTFFATNPALMRKEVAGVKEGTRVLDKEELLAFELVNMLKGDLRKKAIIAEKAPREIRDAGAAQPPKDEKVGVGYQELEEAQQAVMRRLVRAYVSNVPKEVADERIKAITEAGTANVRFAWAGSTKPGVGHYYRIQGPSFLIEFVNTQPDAAGNPANHVHCVWRDMNGDFAIPLK